MSSPGAGGRPSKVPAPRHLSEGTPPAGISADAVAQLAEIRERLSTIDGQNYYDMLGVARDAPADAIRKQYFSLVKRWHPDRVPAEIAYVRPDVDLVFQLLTQAHDTLTDDAKRAQYLRQVQDGGGTPEADRKLAAILTAAMEQQKAEVLMKRRDYVGAKALLERAIDLNPDEPDLHASYAGCLLNVPDSEQQIPEVLRRTEAAIAAAPTHDRAHLYRAMALRRVGREREALDHFQKAAAANPKTLDAVREVRIAQMRGTGAPAEKPKDPKGGGGGSFLDKLFGSSKKKS
jgi:curved DNA-binding protein CbpA